jgi:hypothetical protein
MILISLIFQALIPIMNSVMPTDKIEQTNEINPKVELVLRNLKLTKADIRISTLNMSKTVKKNLTLILVLSMNINHINR